MITSGLVLLVDIFCQGCRCLGTFGAWWESDSCNPSRASGLLQAKHQMVRAKGSDSRKHSEAAEQRKFSCPPIRGRQEWSVSCHHDQTAERSWSDKVKQGRGDASTPSKTHSTSTSSLPSLSVHIHDMLPVVQVMPDKQHASHCHQIQDCESPVIVLLHWNTARFFWLAERAMAADGGCSWWQNSSKSLCNMWPLDS